MDWREAKPYRYRISHPSSEQFQPTIVTIQWLPKKKEISDYSMATYYLTYQSETRDPKSTVVQILIKVKKKIIYLYIRKSRQSENLGKVKIILSLMW